MTKEDVAVSTELLKTFWSSEIIAESLYSFLAADYDDPERKSLIDQLGSMERGHAHAWNKIAADVHGISFRASLLMRSKIVLLKLFSMALPLAVFIHYLEHSEKKAILDYGSCSTVTVATKGSEASSPI